MKQRPQPSIGPGGKAEARSLPQDGEFSGGRGHRCGSTPAWRRFVHIQSWPEPATHCSLALKGEQYVPGIQMPHVNRKEALMDGGATMRNGSMYHLTWYWHSHSEEAQQRSYSMGSSFACQEDIPPRIRGWQPGLSWSFLHHSMWMGVV